MGTGFEGTLDFFFFPSKRNPEPVKACQEKSMFRIIHDLFLKDRMAFGMDYGKSDSYKEAPYWNGNTKIN